ncbi:MAG: glycosyltransferase family 2 protein, partial [Owenweeksia sp.]
MSTTTSAPLISFLTVNYKQAGVTLQLLNSLQKLNYAHWEIIVVDNGEHNPELAEPLVAEPRAIYHPTGANLGFAGGNNAGLHLCKGEYIFFINNDTEVEPDFLDTLNAWIARHPRLGMLSPRICFYQQPDTIQYAGFHPMSTITIRNSGIGWMEKDLGQYNDIRTTAYIHGAAMLVPRKVIDEVGVMYEDYFLYYEEYDWCERVKQAGYEIWYYGACKVYHKESVSTGQDSPLKIYYLTRNRLLFARRNYPAWRSSLAFLYFGLVAVPKNALQWLLKGRRDLALAFLKGFWWNLMHKAKPRENR